MRRRRSSKSSVELVTQALEWEGRPKRVALELSRRPPCELAAARVAAAWRDDQIASWSAAVLLNSIRHPSGFDIVCEMFANPRLSYADSYLASALLEIAPARAPAKLTYFVEHAPTQEGRDEAARGLAQLPPPVWRETLLRAAAAGRVSVHVAAPMLVTAEVEAATVAEWLTSGKQVEAELACAVVAIGARPPSAPTVTSRWATEDAERLLQLLGVPWMKVRRIRNRTCAGRSGEPAAIGSSVGH